MKLTDRLWIEWAYIRRGHTAWLVYIMALANFIAIQYALLIERLPVLENLFPSLSLFSIVFVLTYFPAADLIGRFAYSSKGEYPQEQKVMAKNSPWINSLFDALLAMSEGRNSEAKKILLEYTSQRTEE